MFDSIYMEMKCPYCGKISEIESQTKDLECELENWRKGDFIETKQYNYLICRADCHSDECMKYMLKLQGYRSGFGRGFDTKIYIDEEGIINGRYDIIPDID